MHKHYFPICKVEGAVEPPVLFNHMGLVGSVPNKCGTCKNLFEGECTRAIGVTNRYLHLDHGPCTINGPTDPVIHENEYLKSKLEVPRKCSTCSYLKFEIIGGFYCSQDEKKWGTFHRGLDWGTWEPGVVYVELPFPKITTKALIEFVTHNDVIGFVGEYRRVNQGLSISEAKSDFAYLLDMFKK